MFPINLVVKDETLKQLEDNYIPAISEYDPLNLVMWFGSFLVRLSLREQRMISHIMF